MKKIILALAVLCFSFVAFAQETDKKISYYHAIEVKGLLGGGAGVGISDLHGIQFNPHLVLSLGLGFDYHGFRTPNHKAMDAAAFKTYLELKYIILKRKWSPMISLSAGYYGVYTNYREIGKPIQHNWSNNFLLDTFIGCNYKWSSKNSLYFGPGYDFSRKAVTFGIGVSF